MLSFTETARETVLALMNQDFLQDPAFRVALVPGCSPLAPEYDLSLVEVDESEEGDVRIDGGGFPVFVEGLAARRLEGATVDYVEREGGAGFAVRGPSVERSSEDRPSGPLAERVRQVIEQHVNPGVASHGGHIELVDVRDNVVFIEMRGGCQGCGLAKVTLRQGVERMIREQVPEVAEIRDVTDHAGGVSPYYTSSK